MFEQDHFERGENMAGWESEREKWEQYHTEKINGLREAAENGDLEAMEMMAYHIAKRGYSSREEVVSLLTAASDGGRQTASWKLADYYANWDPKTYHNQIEYYCNLALAGGGIFTDDDPDCIYGSIEYWIPKHHPQWREMEEGFRSDGTYYLLPTGRYGLNVFRGIGEEAARQKTGIKAPPASPVTEPPYPYSYPFLHEAPIGFAEYEGKKRIPQSTEEVSSWMIIWRSIREGDGFSRWSLAAGFEQRLIQCAEGGYDNAWYLLGWYFHERPPVFAQGYTGEDKDFYKKAENYYQKAISLGVAEGHYGLGYLHLFGLPGTGGAEVYTPRDPVESVEHILQAARSGVREAAGGLAKLFRNDIYNPGFDQRVEELGLFSFEALRDEEVARYFEQTPKDEPAEITERIRRALDRLRQYLEG